ncbi:hypothetical protein [Turneriella parva]|uniref:Uncharacterized protein n=1 Tax=Turneriella parva (strain ATCC BAA-1111 / DSM 21527 / NCTC 11395 / H) TaxID=869212 RepID=I4B101_TURPD|nr:hypothetical protein [Turneriella parva]AFM10958.1 hypothetical protein Turpa_0298 [Turneriella parva DSM 21527]
MNFFKKFIASIAGYLVLYAQVAATIGRIAADFFKDRWARFRQMPYSEQAFALLTVLLAFFTFVPWRAYKIRFGDDERRHGIYSDDFAIILLGCIVAAIALVWYLLPHQPKVLQKAHVFRFSGLIIVTVFALWNLINPQRIAATGEAAFTWAFYAFLLITGLWVVSGVLGSRSYAQYPDKT